MSARFDLCSVIKRADLERDPSAIEGGSVPQPVAAFRAEAAQLGFAAERVTLRCGKFTLHRKTRPFQRHGKSKGAARLFLAFSAMARIGGWQGPRDGIADRATLAGPSVGYAQISSSPRVCTFTARPARSIFVANTASAVSKASEFASAIAA